MRVVDLKPGSHPISGTFARPATGDSVDFSGTLELLALLEATVTTAPAAGTVRQAWAETVSSGVEPSAGSAPAPAPASPQPEEGPRIRGERQPRES
jgi:hypothetical protein